MAILGVSQLGSVQNRRTNDVNTNLRVPENLPKEIKITNVRFTPAASKVVIGGKLLTSYSHGGIHIGHDRAKTPYSDGAIQIRVVRRDGEIEELILKKDPRNQSLIAMTKDEAYQEFKRSGFDIKRETAAGDTVHVQISPEGASSFKIYSEGNYSNASSCNIPRKIDASNKEAVLNLQDLLSRDKVETRGLRVEFSPRARGGGDEDETGNGATVCGVISTTILGTGIVIAALATGPLGIILGTSFAVAGTKGLLYASTEEKFSSKEAALEVAEGFVSGASGATVSTGGNFLAKAVSNTYGKVAGYATSLFFGGASGVTRQLAGDSTNAVLHNKPISEVVSKTKLASAFASGVVGAGAGVGVKQVFDYVQVGEGVSVPVRKLVSGLSSGLSSATAAGIVTVASNATSNYVQEDDKKKIPLTRGVLSSMAINGVQGFASGVIQATETKPVPKNTRRSAEATQATQATACEIDPKKAARLRFELEPGDDPSFPSGCSDDPCNPKPDCSAVGATQYTLALNQHISDAESHNVTWQFDTKYGNEVRNCTETPTGAGRVAKLDAAFLGAFEATGQCPTDSTKPLNFASEPKACDAAPTLYKQSVPAENTDGNFKNCPGNKRYEPANHNALGQPGPNNKFWIRGISKTDCVNGEVPCTFEYPKNSETAKLYNVNTRNVNGAARVCFDIDSAHELTPGLGTDQPAYCAVFHGMGFEFNNNVWRPIPGSVPTSGFPTVAEMTASTNTTDVNIFPVGTKTSLLNTDNLFEKTQPSTYAAYSGSFEKCDIKDGRIQVLTPTMEWADVLDKSVILCDGQIYDVVGGTFVRRKNGAEIALEWAAGIGIPAGVLVVTALSAALIWLGLKSRRQAAEIKLNEGLNNEALDANLTAVDVDIRSIGRMEKQLKDWADSRYDWWVPQSETSEIPEQTVQFEEFYKMWALCTGDYKKFPKYLPGKTADDAIGRNIMHHNPEKPAPSDDAGVEGGAIEVIEMVSTPPPAGSIAAYYEHVKNKYYELKKKRDDLVGEKARLENKNFAGLRAPRRLPKIRKELPKIASKLRKAGADVSGLAKYLDNLGERLRSDFSKIGISAPIWEKAKSDYHQIREYEEAKRALANAFKAEKDVRPFKWTPRQNVGLLKPNGELDFNPSQKEKTERFMNLLSKMRKEYSQDLEDVAPIQRSRTLLFGRLHKHVKALKIVVNQHAEFLGKAPYKGRNLPFLVQIKDLNRHISSTQRLTKSGYRVEKGTEWGFIEEKSALPKEIEDLKGHYAKITGEEIDFPENLLFSAVDNIVFSSNLEMKLLAWKFRFVVAKLKKAVQDRGEALKFYQKSRKLLKEKLMGTIEVPGLMGQLSSDDDSEDSVYILPLDGEKRPHYKTLLDYTEKKLPQESEDALEIKNLSEFWKTKTNELLALRAEITGEDLVEIEDASQEKFAALIQKLQNDIKKEIRECKQKIAAYKEFIGVKASVARFLEGNKFGDEHLKGKLDEAKQELDVASMGIKMLASWMEQSAEEINELTGAVRLKMSILGESSVRYLRDSYTGIVHERSLREDYRTGQGTSRLLPQLFSALGWNIDTSGQVTVPKDFDLENAAGLFGPSQLGAINTVFNALISKGNQSKPFIGKMNEVYGTVEKRLRFIVSCVFVLSDWEGHANNALAALNDIFQDEKCLTVKGIFRKAKDQGILRSLVELYDKKSAATPTSSIEVNDLFLQFIGSIPFIAEKFKLVDPSSSRKKKEDHFKDYSKVKNPQKMGLFLDFFKKNFVARLMAPIFSGVILPKALTADSAPKLLKILEGSTGIDDSLERLIAGAADKLLGELSPYEKAFFAGFLKLLTLTEGHIETNKMSRLALQVCFSPNYLPPAMPVAGQKVDMAKMIMSSKVFPPYLGAIMVNLQEKFQSDPTQFGLLADDHTSGLIEAVTQNPHVSPFLEIGANERGSRRRREAESDGPNQIEISITEKKKE